MKKIVVLISLLLMEVAVFSQGGIDFRSMTLKEALLKAREEKKLVFVDCYTSWCLPCKYMADVVFQEKNVGDFMNSEFVCVKYDMEKEEGSELAKKYNVKAYPTFLILDLCGSVRHKFIGGGDAEQFVLRVKEAFDENRALGKLAEKYRLGDKSCEVLLYYAKVLANTYDEKAKDVINELWAMTTDEEKISADYWFIFEDDRFSPQGSDMALFLLKNRERFNEKIGRETVDTRLGKKWDDLIMKILRGEGAKVSDEQLTVAKRTIRSLNLLHGDELLAKLAIAKAIKTDDVECVIKACEKQYEKLEPSIRRLLPYYLSKILAKTDASQRERWERLTDSNR